MHLVIFLRFARPNNNRFAIKYFGNVALSFANEIRSELLSECNVWADLKTASRQQFYELAKQGIAPVEILVPANVPLDLVVFGEDYCKAIAEGTYTAFKRLLQRGDPQ